MVIDVYEAKIRLSELLQRAGRGEEFVLARAGRLVARPVAYRPGWEPRPMWHRLNGSRFGAS